MTDYARPIPTLPTIPTWTLDHLNTPSDGRTHGTPGTHLEQETRKHTRELVLAWVVVLTVFAAINALAIWGITRLPEEQAGDAKIYLALLVIGNIILAFASGAVERIREAGRKRARTLAGLRGERRVAETLAQLPHGYYVVHGVDITAPDRPPEDIDHLVVGPNGITSIDAKNWGGNVTINNDGVYHHGHLDASLIEGTRRRAQNLAAFLGYDSTIRQVVCFTGSARPGRIHAHGIHFTDLNGLLATITNGPATLAPDVTVELAEDAALLAPTATKTVPWRHKYIGVLPQHQRPYRLRHLKFPVALARFLLVLVSVPLTITAVISLYEAWQNTAAAPVLPTIATVIAAALGVLAWQKLGRLERYLDIPSALYLEQFEAPRAKGRMERIYASTAAIANATSGPSLPPARAQGEAAPGTVSATSVTRKELEEAFSKDLILPADTLEELVTVQMLLTRSDEFRASWGQDLPYGIILHGPPGTGKTQIARTIAKTAGFSFYAAKPSDLRDKYVGESAKRIADLYEEARKNAPAMVFLDEIDATAGKRGASSDGAGQENNHAVNQLLQEIDGISKGDATVFTIGATNLLGDLDDAVRSRLAYQILIDLPDDDARGKMWRSFARAFLHRVEVPLDDLMHASHGMSGRDIKQVCQIAAQLSFGQDSERVTRDTLERAFERVGHDFRTLVN